MLHWAFFPSSSTSVLDIFHVVSYSILVFIEKNWLRLCTSNSRSKWVTERHCTEKEIYQLITCSCHCTPSEKWTGRKMYGHTWMTPEGKIPSALKYSSILPEPHMELHGPGRCDSLFPLWQPLFPPPVSSLAGLAAQPWLCTAAATRCGERLLLGYDPLPRLQGHNAVTGCSPASPPIDTIVITKIPQNYVLAAHQISALR